ncbi:DUF5689 domain-containing protein [Gaetbulibacter sp. M235]|uniref:DUF5689 domain-containing protein n=1 Tax=Gaetbulibacter sp. M235 TaxID=3126510 RepID=UPI00374E3A52
MKNIKRILMLMVAVVASFTIASCVQDDDFVVPSSLGIEENSRLKTLLDGATEVSMADVKAMYQEGDFIEAIDTDIYVKGYVSSSDQAGNFFKEFFIQDSPTNPTIALKVILNQVDTYNQFNLGREVYISLKGLYIGEERVGNGVTTIGGGTETDQYGTTVTSLSLNQIKLSVLRSENTMEITPLVVTFSEITKAYVGLLISVENVEFADNLAGKRYFDPTQDYDTQRTLQACGGFNYTQFSLETSAFASFQNELLPTGNGTITAVVSKTFDGSSLILALNTTDDVNFTNSRCSLLDPNDFTTLFEEDFQSATNNTNLNFVGWTNFAEAGSWVWREKVFSGNGYTEFSTFNSGSPSNIAWLVTPGFDMDAQDNEFLNFKTAQHHLESPDNTLEIFVSTDYDGTNVLAATWEPISATLASQSNSWYEFIDSGLIDLSSYTGTLYVAFKVVGSGTDTTLDGAYQVDDFSIIASN